jgi:hypothetical protein
MSPSVATPPAPARPAGSASYRHLGGRTPDGNANSSDPEEFRVALLDMIRLGLMLE